MIAWLGKRQQPVAESRAQAGEEGDDRLHVVLAGDSIFDNAYYVPGGQPVIEQLNGALPLGARASLLAVDGAVTRDVAEQLALLPPDASHLLISAGGNDALGFADCLDSRVDTVGQALSELAEIRREFAENYRAMLAAATATGLELAVCSIYDKVPDLEPAAHTALALFNEVIMREAFSAGIPLIDLRLVCSEDSDYSVVSPIEPSGQGGAKIVSEITGFCGLEKR